MKSTNLYILILGLIIVILLQRTGCTYLPKHPPLSKTDTVIEYLEVHDTVPGKPILLKAKKDTIWRDSIQYKPDTSYAGLLKQYNSLDDKFFTEHIFKTDYKLGTYGTASVFDTVVANMIIGNSIAYSVTIPEKIVTIVRPYSPVKQLYLGGGVYGNPLTPIKAVNVGLLYKDKRDRIFIASIGFDGQPIYGFSSYWKIKLR
jgi:hypothetical protein